MYDDEEEDYERIHQRRVTILNLKEKRDRLPDADPLRKIIQEVISEARTIPIEDLYLFSAQLGIERIARAAAEVAEDNRLHDLEQSPAVKAARQNKPVGRYAHLSPLGYRTHTSGGRRAENDEDEPVELT